MTNCTCSCAHLWHEECENNVAAGGQPCKEFTTAEWLAEVKSETEDHLPHPLAMKMLRVIWALEAVDDLLNRVVIYMPEGQQLRQDLRREIENARRS